MTKEERSYNYASTRKATKFQVGEIAKFYNDGYEQAEQELAPIVQTAICLYESWQCGAMDEVRRYIVELGHLVQPIRKGGYND